jgi:hypothetical protein
MGTLWSMGPSIRATTISTPLISTPLFVNWPNLLPPLIELYQPAVERDCGDGSPQCVDATLKIMQKQFSPLAQTCDHFAVFSLAYLRTTRTYQWSRDQAGYYQNVPWMNYYDAVFADYYFDSLKSHETGDPNVAAAWQIAFNAAANRSVTGSGDLLLGMNAHINRDLAFTLYTIGLNNPDGTSHKPDHDKVNQFLNAEVAALLYEEGARFDPGINNVVTPMGVGYTAFFQTLELWRQQAWLNAEQLAAAKDQATFSLLSHQIEATAAATGQALEAANLATPATTTARDAYCAANWSNHAPIPYPWGTPST